LCRRRRSQRTRRRRECDEECVSLRIDLDAAIGGECLAQDVTVFSEGLSVSSVATLVQKLCRALYVSEEKGDRP
jgi:hypothetical protein